MPQCRLCSCRAQSKDTLQKPSAGGDGIVRIGEKARKGWGMKQLSLATVGFER